MSKAVLISIQPKWCELIASKKKKIEVRKIRPKIKPPFKCYIYQSKKRWIYNIYSEIGDWQGKVIGEFICDKIEEFLPTESGIKFKRFSALYETCLSLKEIKAYLGNKIGYGLHISDLIIYEEPKDLSEFRKPIDCYRGILRENCIGCWDCEITRPPQSWCYVEELGDEE